MKYIDIANKRKIKKIFNQYFLPFSLNEKFLLFNFLLLLIFPIISIINNGFILINITILIPLFILVLLFYNRFFKVIKTNLHCEENIRIIKDIAEKQKCVYQSPTIDGLYMFELQHRADKEFIVFICEDNKIFINTFYQRRLYNVFSKTIEKFKKLIYIKAVDFSKKRIDNSP
ncbi:hypothetical protein [Cloacibacterium sp. TD35]|uniref:hypothetical protein n=1 Tax=Cloacibacterium sp. TD35 TaxID=2976818 RepID=UPI00237D9EF2|nr:hypothetical protein [Cloacibacterium sp. TD35]WDT68242.1 hypothetical protein N7277_01155 [Cloacibacterium sp. TD35]